MMKSRVFSIENTFFSSVVHRGIPNLLLSVNSLSIGTAYILVRQDERLSLCYHKLSRESLFPKSLISPRGKECEADILVDQQIQPVL
jgi:hypothetical protein